MLNLPRPQLERASKMVATIHHSHGVKAAVALSHLRARFTSWDETFWDKALDQAGWNTEPVVNGPVPEVPAGPVSPSRAYAMVTRAVFPYAYSAVRAWVKQSSVESVVARFIDEACSSPGYLGHRLSVLLGFAESVPLFQAGPFEDMWVDRLTEFLVACQFGAPTEEPNGQVLEREALISLALRKPGYFGHHLITLMWVLRNEKRLTQRNLEHSLLWVATACSTAYTDDEDNVTIDDSFLAACQEKYAQRTVELALKPLLTQGISNIHLLTLADALAWMWEPCSPQQRELAFAVAQKFVPGEA